MKYRRLSSEASFVRESNNFDALRLFAAFLVFYSHCYPLFGRAEPEFLSSPKGAMPISPGAAGVTIFFVISGFLIPASWENRSEIAPYLMKRVLRIYPGLTVNFFFVYLGLVPFYCTISASEYFNKVIFSLDWFFLFLKNLALMRSTDLTIVFSQNPLPYMVNGPLWTLPHEFLMYLAVLIAGITVGFRKYFFVLPLLFFCYLALIANAPATEPELAILFYGAFVAGASLYLFRKHVPINGYLFFLCLLTMSLLSVFGFYSLLIYTFALSYIVVFLAFLKVPYLNHAGRFGDLSFGVYIYAWPVQQLFVTVFLSRDMFWSYVFISLLVTVTLAFFSWRFVEGPALALKKFFLPRGKGRYLM